MSINKLLTNNLKHLNNIINKNIDKITLKEINKLKALLKAEIVFLQLKINEIANNTNEEKIKINKNILKEYLDILNNVNNDIIVLNPELYYVIITYIKYLIQDRKTLSQNKSKLLSYYYDYLEKEAMLNSQINIVLTAMEIGDDINNIFKCNIYKKTEDFEFIKKICNILFNEMTTKLLSKTPSNSVSEDISSDNNSVFSDNEVTHSLEFDEL